MIRSVWRLVLTVIASLALTVIASLALTGVAISSVAAQEAVTPHPAHLHEGTCEVLDPNPAYPLTEVASVAPDAAAGAVEASQTTVEVTLDDLLASPYALNVHESAENASVYIACGDVAGPVVDGTLVIGLNQQNDSGYAGVALLSSNDAGGTDVTVYLAPGLAGSGTDAATPVAADSTAAEEVTVSIIDFAFDAEVIEIPVGTTVTWTNDGQIIHTTTAFADGDRIWDSGIMETGDTFSYTFEEEGIFEYLCTIHPDMVGQVVVIAP